MPGTGWFGRWFSRGRRQKRRRQHHNAPAARRVRPVLELLEDRLAPALNVNVLANVPAPLTGDSVGFTATVTDAAGNPVSAANLDWDFHYDGSTFHPDGAAAGQLTPTHGFTQAGPDTVAVRAADQDGSATLTTVALDIQPFPEVWIETSDDAPIINTSVEFTAQTDGDLDPTQYFTVAWDTNFDGQAFHANAGLTDFTAQPTFGTAGARTVAVQLTDAAGQAVLVTLGLTVHNVPPALTVPEDMTVSAGQTVTLPASATDASGIAGVVWQVSFDGGDFVTDPTLTGLTVSYPFAHYGEYDLLVRVTDNNGETAEGSFHVTAAESAPHILSASSNGPVVFGDPVTFTVRLSTPDDSDTVTVFADWQGTGDFDEVDVSDSWVNADGSLSFQHVYDSGSPEGGFPAVIAVMYDGGQSDSATVNVVVNDPPTLGELRGGAGNGPEEPATGWQLTDAATSGQDVWAVLPGTPVTFADVSSAHETGRTYHWFVNNGPEVITGEPVFTVPNMQDGDSAQVRAFVQDQNGRASEPQTITVVWTLYANEANAPPDVPLPHLVRDGLYGSLTFGGQGQPAHYNRFANQTAVTQQFNTDTKVVVTYTLDDASRQYLADHPTYQASYSFHVRVFDTANNSQLLYDGWVTNTSGTLTLPDAIPALGIDKFGNDRRIVVEGAVQVSGWGTVNGAFASPIVVTAATTPHTPGFWERIGDAFTAVRNLISAAANLVGEWATRLGSLVTTAVSSGAELLSTLTVGLRDAVSQVLADLTNTNLGENAFVRGLVKYVAGQVTIPFPLPTINSLDDVKNFLLQYSGLTWQNVLTVIRQQLGEGNYAALARINAFVAGLTQNNTIPTPLAILQALPNLLTAAERAALSQVDLDLLNQLDWSNLGTRLVQQAQDKLGQLVPGAVSRLAAKFVPGAGLVSMLYQGVSFLINNIGQLGALFDSLGTAIDKLISLDTNQFKQKLVDLVEGNLLPLFIGFAATQLGLTNLAPQIQSVINWVPTKVNQGLRAIIAKIASVMGGGGSSSAGMFAGKLAPEKVFSYGGSDYALWTVKDTPGVRIKVATRPNANAAWTLIGALSADSFSGTTPRTHFNTLLSAAQALANSPTTGSSVPSMTTLQQRQDAIVAAEEVLRGDIQAGNCLALGACFAAGTRLWTPEGYVKVEDMRPGQSLYARDEADPHAPVEVKVVEDRFERTGRILHLHLPGEKLIRTTPQHPFFVYEQGWTVAGALRAGDLIRTDDGWVSVEEVFDTGEYEKVYNVRVADHHTYFVGAPGWEFALWAHNDNACAVVADLDPALRSALIGSPQRLRGTQGTTVDLTSSTYFTNSFLEGYGSNRNIRFVYALVDRSSGVAGSERVLKVGETSPSAARNSGWRDRFLKYRRLAQTGLYWKSTQSWTFPGAALKLYVFAVPATDVTEREGLVRRAMYDAGQSLPLDFTVAGERTQGQWLTRHAGSSLMGQTNSTRAPSVNLAAKLQGTPLQGMTPYRSVNLNSGSADTDLAALDAAAPAGQWLYMLEAPDAPGDQFKILKVGQVTRGLVSRYGTSGQNYKYMAWSRYNLTWHLFRLQDIPAERREGKSLTDLEVELRQGLYNQWQAGSPNWLPEDRSINLPRNGEGDPMPAVFSRYQ
jgi:hypothetical protein